MTAREQIYKEQIYKVPRSVTDSAVVSAVSSVGRTRPLDRSPVERTYLDTADGRLRRAGLSLHLETPPGAILGVLTATADGHESTRQLTRGPEWGEDLRDAGSDPDGSGPAWRAAAAAVAPRRLTPQIHVSGRRQRFSVLDAEEKTVARVVLERLQLTPGPPDGPRDSRQGGPDDSPHGRRDGRRPRTVRLLTLHPLRGYERTARQLSSALARAGLVPIQEPFAVLAAAAGLPSRSARALGQGLDRSMPVGRAVSLVLVGLRADMVGQEDGMRRMVDTEFLHEYRVAGRRARSILKAVRPVVGEDRARSLSGHLAWLGGFTGPARDLDVQLLDLANEGTDLEPLRRYLEAERQRCQASLIGALDSDRYRLLLSEWTETESRAAGSGRRQKAGEVVDDWVRVAYGRVIRKGRAIQRSTPAAALHDLRKRAKELRYLLECFASLYDDRRRARAVKDLKSLQDNLGEFQDCQVQAEALRTMAGALMAEADASAAALMAMGRMAERLEGRENQARAAFEERFALFDAPAAHRRFEAMLAETPAAATPAAAAPVHDAPAPATTVAKAPT